MTKRVLFIALFSILILSGCSEFQRIQKKGSYEDKYEAALKYYEKDDFYRASVLLESIIPLTKGKKEAEDVQLKYAYCQYNQREFYLASYYFKKFAETFPRSESTEESLYMSAISLYRISPIHQLDQSNTYKAIDALQSFVNSYPETKFMEECNTKINNLQKNLERKAYENAKLDFNIGRYRAAVIDFENFSKDFPDSKFNEELAYLKIEAQYRFAKNSFEKLMKDGKYHYLKRDRYIRTKEFYYAFIDAYPQSEYLKEAETIFNNSKAGLTELENKG